LWKRPEIEGGLKIVSGMKEGLNERRRTGKQLDTTGATLSNSKILAFAFPLAAEFPVLDPAVVRSGRTSTFVCGWLPSFAADDKTTAGSHFSPRILQKTLKIIIGGASSL
jgi:hypothetical protein